MARAHFRALCAPEYSEDPPKNQPKNDENHDFLTFQVHRARASARAPNFFSDSNSLERVDEFCTLNQ